MHLHTSCPHCGNKLSADNPHFTSHALSSHAPKDEVVLLNEEVGRLDDMIRQLQQRRSMLLGRTNTVQSPIGSIPAEVLSQIFLYACSRIVPRKKSGTHPDIAPSSVLTAVCSRWRQVATSTPELWATISLDIKPSTIRSDVALLKTSFEHAKQCPMTLSLNLEPYPEFSDDEDDTSMPYHLVLETLHERADRIRSLQIDSMPIDWIYAVQWGQFSALTGLQLHWVIPPKQKEKRNKRFSLPNTIQKLSIRDFPYVASSKLILPTSITSLCLDGMQINRCVKLLAQCPNLLKLSSTNVRVPHPSGAQVSMTGIVVMAHLEELEWEWIESSWSDAFIRHFQFPALRKLQWRGLCRSTLGNLALEAFWNNLPTTMTKLDVLFQESRPSSQDVASFLLQIFRHFPGIVELGIAITPSDNGSSCIAASAEGVLKALQVENSVGVNNQDKILPSLKILRWMTKRPSDVYYYLLDQRPLNRLLIDAHSLVQMLSTRKTFGLKFFGLIWEGDIKFEADHKETIAELVAGGLNINIITIPEENN